MYTKKTLPGSALFSWPGSRPFLFLSRSRPFSASTSRSGRRLLNHNFIRSNGFLLLIRCSVLIRCCSVLLNRCLLLNFGQRRIFFSLPWSWSLSSFSRFCSRSLAPFFVTRSRPASPFSRFWPFTISRFWAFPISRSGSSSTPAVARSRSTAAHVRTVTWPRTTTGFGSGKIQIYNVKPIQTRKLSKPWKSR